MGWDPFKEAKDYVEEKVAPVAADLVSWTPPGFMLDLATGGKVSETLGAEHGPNKEIRDLGRDIAAGPEGIAADLTGKTGAEAATKAAETQAEAMTQQLDYLKEINRLPQQYKEQALTRLNDIYSGGEGSMEAQQGMIDQAKASPYYQAMMSGQQAGEESVMRHAAQTGGLRSGNVQSAMYDYNAQLQNQALAGAYGQQMSGLQGLAGLGTNEQQIGQTMGDIGSTQAAGILGAAQSRQAGTANMMNLGLGLGGLGLELYKL